MSKRQYETSHFYYHFGGAGVMLAVVFVFFSKPDKHVSFIFHCVCLPFLEHFLYVLAFYTPLAIQVQLFPVYYTSISNYSSCLFHSTTRTCPWTW